MSWKRGNDDESDDEQFDEEELLGEGNEEEANDYFDDDDHASLLDEDNDVGGHYQQQQNEEYSQHTAQPQYDQSDTGQQYDDQHTEQYTQEEQQGNSNQALDEELLASEAHISDDNDDLIPEDESDGQTASVVAHLGTLDTQVNDEEYAEISDLNTTTEHQDSVNKPTNNNSAGTRIPDAYSTPVPQNNRGSNVGRNLQKNTYYNRNPGGQRAMRYPSPPNLRRMPYQQTMQGNIQINRMQQYQQLQQIIQRPNFNTLGQPRTNIHPLQLNMGQRDRAAFLTQSKVYNDQNINQQLMDLNNALLRQQRQQPQQQQQQPGRFRNPGSILGQPIQQQANFQMVVNNQQQSFRPSLPQMMMGQNRNNIASAPRMADFTVNLNNRSQMSRIQPGNIQFNLTQQPLQGKPFGAAQPRVSPQKQNYNNIQLQQPAVTLKKPPLLKPPLLKPPLLADPPLRRERSKSPAPTASQSNSHQSLNQRKANMSDNFQTKNQLHSNSTIVISTAVSADEGNSATEGEEMEGSGGPNRAQLLQIDYDHGHNNQNERANKRRSTDSANLEVPSKRAATPETEYERQLAKQAAERERIRKQKEANRLAAAREAAKMKKEAQVATAFVKPQPVINKQQWQGQKVHPNNQNRKPRALLPSPPMPSISDEMMSQQSSHENQNNSGPYRPLNNNGGQYQNLPHRNHNINGPAQRTTLITTEPNIQYQQQQQQLQQQQQPHVHRIPQEQNMMQSKAPIFNQPSQQIGQQISKPQPYNNIHPMGANPQMVTQQQGGVKDGGVNVGYPQNQPHQPQYSRAPNFQSGQYNQQQVQQHQQFSQQQPIASHQSQAQQSSLQDVPQYAQSRVQQPSQLTSAQFNVQPQQEGDLHGELYSQQYSNQYSQQQKQPPQIVPIQELHPPSNSPAQQVPASKVPGVPLNNMNLPPVFPVAQIPSQSMIQHRPQLPNSLRMPSTIHMSHPNQTQPPQIVNVNQAPLNVQQPQFIQPPSGHPPQYQAQIDQNVQQYQSQIDPALAYNHQQGQVGAPLPQLQNSAPIPQRQVQPKTVLINPKFNPQKQQEKREQQERQQLAREMMRVRQQQVRARPASSSRSRDGSRSKGERLHPLDELYQVAEGSVAEPQQQVSEDYNEESVYPDSTIDPSYEEGMENPEENPEEYLENDGIPMEYQAVEGDMPEYQEDEDGDPPASPEQYVSMEPATPPTVHRAIKIKEGTSATQQNMLKKVSTLSERFKQQATEMKVRKPSVPQTVRTNIPSQRTVQASASAGVNTARAATVQEVATKRVMRSPAAASGPLQRSVVSSAGGPARQQASKTVTGPPLQHQQQQQPPQQRIQRTINQNSAGPGLAMSSSLRAAQASLSAAAARAMSAESAPRPAAAVQRAVAVRPATTVHGAKLVPAKTRIVGKRTCCKVLNLDPEAPVAVVREMGEACGVVDKVGRLRRQQEVVVITFKEEAHGIAFRRQYHNTEVLGNRIKVEFIAHKSNSGNSS